MNMHKNYWLMKSEGDCYPIDQLKKDKTTAWSGVRNYQARNYMKEMKIGDMILFYHSSTKPITMDEMKRHSQLSTMKLFQKGSRLSVIPVTEKEYRFIVSL